MAFWVFYGHLQISCIGTPPRFGHPANAVEIFMILSGFLMTYHWLARQERFAGASHQTIDFYFRRFFRIAPLYYLLFTIAFLGAAWFSASPTPVGFSTRLADALAHYTFVFGAFPQYVSNNVLPDWSIGLEMQFYLCFPLLIWALTRWGSLATVFAAIVMSYATRKLIGLYDGPPGPLGHFAQPGLLLFKVDIFIAGMCLAFHWRERSSRRCIPWLVLAAICLVQSTIQVQGLVMGALLLLHFDASRQDFCHKVLTGRIARFAGDTSYSVYLLHLMLLQPILALLNGQAWFTSLPGAARVGVALLAIGLPLYSIAAVLYRFVELPGIAWGRKVAASVSARLGYRSVPLTTSPF